MLISIFVLAVGLLSVAALMPLANHEVEQGQQLEKVVVVGDWAISTMEAAGGFDPSRWVYQDGTQFDAVHPIGRRLIFTASGGGPKSVTTSSPGLSPAGGFYVGCIVEFRSGKLKGIKRSVATYSSGNFTFPNSEPDLPVTPTSDDTFTVTRQQGFAIDPLFIAEHDTDNDAASFPYANSVMPRITLTRGVGQPEPMDKAMADSLFTSTDSLAINLPDDTSLMPEQIMIDSDGDGDRDDKRMFEGEYSYLITMAPNTADNSGMMTASVAVFESRRLGMTTGEANTPSIAFASGLGGGSAELDQYLPTLVPGQWILVRSTVGPAAYFWYRVAAVRLNDDTGTSTNVSLVGPDWRRDFDNDNANDPGVAVVFNDEVVGVYSRPVRIRNLPIGPVP